MHDSGSNGLLLFSNMTQQANVRYALIEHVEYGDLNELVHGLKEANEDSARFFFEQLLDGIDYIHSSKVVHRDLKLENMLVDKDLTLKICDFGFCSDESIGFLD